MPLGIVQWLFIQIITTMKKYITIPIISALLLTLGASNATARNDEALYAIGGFIGGVITTKALDRHHHKSHHHKEVVYVDRNCSARNYTHGHNKHRCDHGCKHSTKPSGYYKNVSVRKWVPGCWEIHYNRCGDRVRTWTEGYYTYVEKRVWVENNQHGRGHEYARR